MKKFLPILVGLILALVFYHEFVFGSFYLFDMDIHTEFLPLQKFISNAFFEGGEGWWNRFSGMGLPLLADGHAGHYYLPSMFFRVLGANPSLLGFFWCLHLIYGFYFMHKFASELGASQKASYLAAIAFCFSGSLSAITSTFMYAISITHTPALFYFLFKTIKSLNIKYPLYLGLIFSQQFMIGYVPFTFNTIIALGIFYFFSGFKNSIKRIIFAASIGILFSLPQLVPTIKYITESNLDQGVSYEYTVSNSLSPKLLLSYLFPLVWGSNDPNNPGLQDDHSDKMQDYFDFDELHHFIGILPLLLGLFVFFFIKKSEFKGLKVLAVISLLLGLGAYFPFLSKLLFYLPGFSSFKDPSKWAIHLNFALVILAAVGLDSISINKILRKRFNLFLIGTVILVAVGVSLGGKNLFIIQNTPYCTDSMICLPHQFLAPIWLFLLTFTGYLFLILTPMRTGIRITLCTIFVFFELFIIESGLIPKVGADFYQAQTHVLDLKQTNQRVVDGVIPREFDSLGINHLSGDIGALYEIPTLTVTSPLVTKSWEALSYWTEVRGMIDLQRFTTFESESKLIPTLASLGVGSIIEKDYSVKKIQDARPLAYLSYQSNVVEKDQGLEFYLNGCESGHCSEALIEKNIGITSEHIPLTPAQINFKNSEKVEITVEAKAPGILVYMDQYYPGWSATLNDEPTEVIKVNGLFKGVKISNPGINKIEFSFNPLTYRLGKWWFWISWILVLLLIGITRNFNASCNYGRWKRGEIR